MGKSASTVGSTAASIIVRNAHANNLQNVDLELPLHQLTVVTGPSGSGKSSLVFDVLHAEAERRFAMTHGTSRVRAAVPVEQILGLSFAVGIRPRRLRESRARVLDLVGCLDGCRALFFELGTRHCLKCGQALEIRTLGGLLEELLSGELAAGETDVLAPMACVPAELRDLQQTLLKRGFSKAYHAGERLELVDVAEADLENDELLLWLDRIKLGRENQSRLAESVELALAVSGGRVSFTKPALDAATKPYCPVCRLEQTAVQAADFSFQSREDSLPSPEVMALTLAGISFSELFAARVERALEWTRAARQEVFSRSAVLAEVLRDVERRLECLNTLGLAYLELSRPISTLSTGEAYRVRLARQLSHKLQGVLYLLDEPSVGLSTGDVEKLLSLLRELISQGNTVIGVEQHEVLLAGADQVVEFGPAAGIRGGRVMRQGSPAELNLAPLKINRVQRQARGQLQFGKIRKLHLDISELNLPLGVLVGISGVSGSGKTTLLTEVLVPALREQQNLTKSKDSPVAPTLEVKGAEQLTQIFDAADLGLSGSELSIAASALEIWPRLREIFSQTVEAKRLGLTAGAFSLRKKQAQCPDCGGRGELRRAGEDLELEQRCEKCAGSGLHPELLSVRYRNLSLADVLALTVAEAAQVFLPLSDISRPLKTAERLGLGYLKLGERTSQFSGGELQRLALAAVLGRGKIAPATGSIFFFDEPTAGLSRDEVVKFMEICDELLDAGYSVVMAEHHPAILAAVDYLIELGPGAGEQGGKVMRTGWRER